MADHREILSALRAALTRHEAATDAITATAAGDDPHAAALAGIELDKANALLATWTQPEYLRALIDCASIPAPAEGDERAAFEAWYVDAEGPRIVTRGLLERVQAGPFAGDYRDGQVQGAWNVWQGAMVSKAKPKGTADLERQLDEVLKERDAASDYIDALLDEVLGADRHEWTSNYGHADAMEEVRERMSTLLQPMADRAWNRFEAALQAPAPGHAEEWLRSRYGAYRGHHAWRELEDAFNAGSAKLAAALAENERLHRQNAVLMERKQKAEAEAKTWFDQVQGLRSHSPAPAPAWRADYPASEAELSAEREKARADERLFGLGATVNGWHVPSHVVSIYRPAQAAPEVPSPAVGAEQPWQAMLYAPRDGSKIELLVEHREYWIALKAGRADGYRQACEGHWVDFNGGGWSWMGTAGQPIGWRPLRAGPASDVPVQPTGGANGS